MKLLIINGSPKINGNTKACALVLSRVFEENDIDVEIFDLGKYSFKTCIACGSCFRTKKDLCVLDDDMALLITKVKEADAIILSSPIHYADISALAKTVYDRLFYISSANGNYFRHKVGASFITVRRTGGIAGFHTLNNYLLYSEMFLATSSYWNVIHGQLPNEVEKDDEGIDTLHVLANNIIYLMNVLKNSKIEKPEPFKKRYTNFIR